MDTAVFGTRAMLVVSEDKVHDNSARLPTSIVGIQRRFRCVSGSLDNVRILDANNWRMSTPCYALPLLIRLEYHGPTQ